jgi:hypothetical protein
VRRNLGEASLHLHKALVLLREIGPDRDRLSTEWGLARVVMHGGDQNDAIARLQTVAAEFQERSMITDAALVRLDVIEVLLADAQFEEIAKLAGDVFKIFRSAGMLTGALTAMAYLKDAATSRKLTAHGIATVRTYLRRTERQLQLAFQPPPDGAFR